MNKIFSKLRFRQVLGLRSFANRLTADGKVIPKVKNDANRITLINQDNSVSITDLKNAENISERRDLKLVKIQDVDAKTRRPIYKLMTNSEYHEEELKKRKEKQENRLKGSSVKGEKLLSISSKIGEHDLMTSVKKMMKLLEKHYEVKVIVSGEGGEETQRLNAVCGLIEKNISNIGKIEMKRNKGNSLRFQLVPNKDKGSEGSKNSSLGGSNGSDKGPL